MKFIYFGYDFMLPCVSALMNDGHELGGVFTFECDNISMFNQCTIALAQGCGVPVILGKPQDIHIENFIAEGAKAFIAAGYPYKIPAITPDIDNPIDNPKAYGINIHPSLLPKGRGIMPSPYILTDHPEASGLSIHKLTQDFDAGDILDQVALPLNPNENVETLSARMVMAAPAILSRIMSNLPKYWSNATPQDESQASYFPLPSEDMRTLDWSKSIHDIDKTARSFGRYGTLAHFDEQFWLVYDHDVWKEEHKHTPGEVVCRLGTQITIAALDGFVCLKDLKQLICEQRPLSIDTI